MQCLRVYSFFSSNFLEKGESNAAQVCCTEIGESKIEVETLSQAVSLNSENNSRAKEMVSKEIFVSWVSSVTRCSDV